MKIYDYTKYDTCFLGPSVDNRLDEIISIINNGLPVGMSQKVHPKEIERLERIKKRDAEYDNVPERLRATLFSGEAKKKKQTQCFYSYENAVMIVAGSCGFGTKDFEYFDKKFKELNDVLKENNFHILFVRGNNDDPSYFDEEKINYSNIKTLVSNCIVKFVDFNCLCIGGGISFDREWKKSKSKEFKKEMYWENECIDFDIKDISNAMKDNPIACVITHDIPTFIEPSTGAFKNNRWFKNDKNLLNDVTKSRVKLDLIYQEFVKQDKKPYVWWHSFSEQNRKNLVNEILFKSSHDIESLNEIVRNHFNLYLTENEKKMSERIFKRKKISYADLTWDDTWEITTEPNDPGIGRVVQQEENAQLFRADDIANANAVVQPANRGRGIEVVADIEAYNGAQLAYNRLEDMAINYQAIVPNVEPVMAVGMADENAGMAIGEPGV